MGADLKKYVGFKIYFLFIRFENQINFRIDQHSVYTINT